MSVVSRRKARPGVAALLGALVGALVAPPEDRFAGALLGAGVGLAIELAPERTGRVIDATFKVVP